MVSNLVKMRGSLKRNPAAPWNLRHWNMNQGRIAEISCTCWRGILLIQVMCLHCLVKINLGWPFHRGVKETPKDISLKTGLKDGGESYDIWVWIR